MGAAGVPGTSVVSQYRVRPDRLRDFAHLQADIAVGLEQDPDYRGGESYRSTDSGTLEHTVVRHFATRDGAHRWLASPELAALEEHLDELLEGPPTRNVLVEPRATESASASIVVNTRVKQGSEEWFAEFQGRMATAQSQYPGFAGQRQQAPLGSLNRDWVTIVAFDSPEHLRDWLDSPVRQALVEESAPHVEQYEYRPASSAFESWFAGSESGAKPPPAWKLSAIVLLVLYPVVMLEILTINRITEPLGTPLATFIGNAISVALTGFVLIPVASRALNWWLVPPESREPLRTWQGAAVVVALYALSVLFFVVVDPLVS